jgi:hypothetical protein
VVGGGGGIHSDTAKRSSSLLPIEGEGSFCIIMEDISENPPAPWLDIMLAIPTCMPGPPREPNPPGGEVA